MKNTSSDPSDSSSQTSSGTNPWARSAVTEDARALAAVGLNAVIQGQSLNQCLPALEQSVLERDRAFLRELVLGSCRYFQRLNALAKMLLKQPFREEQEVLHALLIVGLYQLHVQEKAAHAAIHATVDACEALQHSQAKAVINACLRRFQREQAELIESLKDNPVTTTSHPKWLVKMLTKAWPEHWQSILEQNNQAGPLCLRINQRKTNPEDWLKTLEQQQAEVEPENRLSASPATHSKDGLYLSQSCDITALPGFAEGEFSVQDEAAQLCASILKPQNGERILDACAAPGGKTGHLLEQADIQLTAVELEESRIGRIHENLERLQLRAEVICADAADPKGEIDGNSAWWDGNEFDAILLDAPCSATGVIRRHPDIKLLRRREDIDALAALQARLLDTSWQMLKSGGRLLYATCSVLPQENSEQIAAFLSRHADAQLHSLEIAAGIDGPNGRQLFPVKGGHDGFYYALLSKV
ncbi:MAG: 16S rRNA (cytosine(967)-C(5))-methyltransferase RsmB [Oceanobacter sp.]